MWKFHEHQNFQLEMKRNRNSMAILPMQGNNMSRSNAILKAYKFSEWDYGKLYFKKAILAMQCHKCFHKSSVIQRHTISRYDHKIAMRNSNSRPWSCRLLWWLQGPWADPWAELHQQQRWPHPPAYMRLQGSHGHLKNPKKTNQRRRTWNEITPNFWSLLSRNAPTFFTISTNASGQSPKERKKERNGDHIVFHMIGLE